MAKSYVRLLLRGVVEPLLLFIIGELLPIHGYEIARELERRSQGVEGLYQARGSTLPNRSADVIS